MNKDIIIKTSDIIPRHQLTNWCANIYSYFDEPQKLYPGFNLWYRDTFVPGVIDGSRRFIICERCGIIIGLALLKSDQTENKICRIEVASNHRNTGLGKTLFEKSFEIFDTTKPVITISEERICMFSRLISYYGFELTDICSNIYRIGSKEFVFNGYLDQRPLGRCN